MAEKSAQIIFCDTSTPKTGFNIYDEVKNMLLSNGIPSDKIAFIHDAQNETQRSAMFAKVRNGDIRILLGSTFKLGLGVNIQDKLIALHHIDVPWRPADMTQREGRILRRGNTNSKVQIFRYITEGSFDAYSWQLLETKQRFITGLLSGSLTERSGKDIEDTVLDYAEVKALAVGNPLVKERVETANELSRYLTLQRKLVESRIRMEKGSAYDELNQMIGLDEAKKVINRALDYYKAQKLFADKGMKADHPAMHMVFTGNPGTAKTTVARLFARIMQENGFLSKGNLIEVGRGDLVGKYVGWTAPTIQKKFKEAQGSVLFIDEAYSLVDDRSGSFGDEAINTIVQEMENHREDVVVIFAGYPDEMEGFLQKNPGLRSRIAYHVPFADYDTESLCAIAKLIAGQKGLTLTDDACRKLTELFDTARTEGDFGNGRYVRNVIEKARMAQATRLLSMDFDSIGSKEMATICAEDIEQPMAKAAPQRNRIGFSA